MALNVPNIKITIYATKKNATPMLLSAGKFEKIH